MWGSTALKFESQWIWDPSDVWFNFFEIQVVLLSVDLRFNRFGCQLIRDGSALIVNHWFGVQLVCDSSKWLKIQVLWDSTDDFKFKCFKFNCVRGSTGLKVNRLRFKWWAGHSIWDSIDVRFIWFGVQWVWNSRNEVWKLKHEAFLRDFLQKGSFKVPLPQPFHRFSVLGLKHRPQNRNPCACHAKSIISDLLHIHHACQRFCNPHEMLCLPRILQRAKIPEPATRKAFWISKNAPSAWCVLTVWLRNRSPTATWWAFCGAQLQTFSEHGAWCFFSKIVLSPQRGANFGAKI